MVNYNSLSVADKKLETIKRILQNQVYTPESGLYKNVSKALSKLSLVDLAALEVIIGLRK